ncbi:polysaccharide deacetylase family protein [Flammeovirga sp. EKP202]|uniref:polysaccharide deacetylase family protein n=1 Tax=Flammeovirga sp. EKP202 TaxID=2770592 RepID=UPI00165FC313|nr:polysaccharide deacetylase family protein [Flammeovirga sp. EKP202]MBD0403583.1 polysaccharide deacetylase family protein [Flammeovirga sp. EKP202]
MIQKVGSIFRNKIFPSLVWKKEATTSPILYLTFDDGPIPEITPWVLDELKKYNAKATFFCVGDNIRKHPEVYQQVLEQGHKVGNHTFNHLQYWKKSLSTYLQNVKECDTIMKSNPLYSVESEKPLFRPPHGQVGKKMMHQLLVDYEIIMWHVLTRDYNKNYKKESCLKAAIKNTENGSIIVFHDSIKAEKNLKYVLPRYLQYFSNKGYEFHTL